MNTINPKELNEKMKNNDDICILDVRAEDKYANGHIKCDNFQTINIPKTLIFNLDSENAKEVSSLPKEKEIIVTCTTGNSAKKCAIILAEKGYKVTLLEGGVTAWNEYNHSN